MKKIVKIAPTPNIKLPGLLSLKSGPSDRERPRRRPLRNTPHPRRLPMQSFDKPLTFWGNDGCGMHRSVLTLTDHGIRSGIDALDLDGLDYCLTHRSCRTPPRLGYVGTGHSMLGITARSLWSHLSRNRFAILHRNGVADLDLAKVTHVRAGGHPNCLPLRRAGRQVRKAQA